MLNIFPLVETLDFPEHPAEHGIVYDVIVVPPSLRHGATSRINSMRNEPFSLLPTLAKGTLKIAEKRGVATGIFARGQC